MFFKWVNIMICDIMIFIICQSYKLKSEMNLKPKILIPLTFFIYQNVLGPKGTSEIT